MLHNLLELGVTRIGRGTYEESEWSSVEADSVRLFVGISHFARFLIKVGVHAELIHEHDFRKKNDIQIFVSVNISLSILWIHKS